MNETLYKDRAAELRNFKDEKSVFTYSLRDDLRVFGDGDSDLDKHLESFQDVCLVVKLIAPGFEAIKGFIQLSLYLAHSKETEVDDAM